MFGSPLPFLALVLVCLHVSAGGVIAGDMTVGAKAYGLVDMQERRRGAPSPNARFLRDGACGASCLPPGQLLDFGTSDPRGPPKGRPGRPEPPLIAMPVSGSGAFLLLGLGMGGLVSRGLRRKSAG